MLVNMSHIISDGWSVGVMIREFCQMYDAFPEGRESPLRPLRIQYRDYAVWQRHLLESDEIRTHREYWHEKLSGEIPVLDFPGDYPRPPVQTFNGKTLFFTLSPDRTRHLGELSRKQGVSLFMTLMATVKVLFFRYTGQDDIIIGSPTAGRFHADLEDQIGYYLNTLALRDRVQREESFVSFLRQVGQTATEAFDHQVYPFDRLVDELGLRHDLSRSPLFDVMLILQNTEAVEFSLKGLEITEFERELLASKLDMTFNFMETKEGLRFDIEYNTDLFQEDRVQKIAAHFQVLTDSILADPDQPLGLLNILSDAEYRQLLHDYNDTDADYPPGRTVTDLFEEHAEKSPDNIAVVFEETRLTYRELNEQANQIAHFLADEYNIQPDDRVGLLLRRSDRIITGILGILKSGGAYVPIDSEYPPERIRHIVRDSGCKVVLTETGVQELSGLSSDIADIRAIRHENKTNPAGFASLNHLAYMIYTSGSTGVPKGVLIEHRNLYDYVMTFISEFSVSSEDRFLQQTTIAFDASVEEIYPALCTSATLFVCQNPKDIESLFTDVVRHGISIVSLSPLAVSYFNTRAHELKDLRVLISGGDVLHASFADRLYERTRVYNTYGPTEATVCAAYHRMETTDGSVPIGRPIANRRIYILDPALNPLPAGVFGEICISGAGTARGYLNREDLTREKFIPHPFEEGKRLYCTGDLGRWLPDGTIEFLGRNDDQVKIRGYRIELGEIESRILTHEAVKEAAVIARGKDDHKELAAYIAGEGELNVSVLREHLMQTLPDYMIPSSFVQMEDFPLTPSGKVDKKALPDPSEAGMDSGIEYVAPHDDAERKLAKIWQEVLGIEKIGIRDNFFDLGGHSLRAVQITNRIHRELGADIPLREIFASPTIGELAKQLRSGDPSAYIPIERTPIAEYYPVSHAQRRLWILNQIDQADGGASVYNIPAALELSGELNREILEKTFSELILRHESLRTTFLPVDGEPRQKICEPADFQIRFTDLTTDGHPEETARETACEHAEKPFDLEKGPLLSVSLLKLSETRHILLVNMSHIISDGWSVGILIREFCQLYDAFLEGRENPLPRLCIQCKDYAVWQNRLLESEEIAAHRDYWHGKLSGEIPVLELPADYSRPPVQTFSGNTFLFTFSPEKTERLREFSRDQEASLFMTLLAAVKTLLHCYTGQEDIIVGSPSAGRDRSDIENQIGFYVNTLALRDQVRGEECFRAFLGRVRETASEAFSHQVYPFDKIVDELNLHRDISRSPIFDVMVVLQNVEDAEIALKGLRIEPFDTAFRFSMFDLTFTFWETEEELTIAVEYNTDLFREDRINRMAEHFQVLTDSILADPEKPVAALNILPEKERNQVLYEFNNTAADYPSDKTVVDLFEDRAEKTPENTALVFEDIRLSYRELNEQANRIAHFLRDEYDIQPDDRVGLFLERSEQTLVGILGILKSGGAYVPMDPGHPADRIQLMIADSGCRLVLSEARLIRAFADIQTPQAGFADIRDIRHENTANPERSASPHDLAYMIYTSGSTGVPKGVLTEHRNLYDYVMTFTNEFRVTSGDRFLQQTTISFDASVEEIYPPLCTGAELFLCGDSRELDVLFSDVLRHRISILSLSPAAVNYFNTRAEELGGELRTLISGGDVLHSSFADRLFGKTVIYNTYGPTEATVCGTYHRIRELSDPVPIGRPIANRRIYILDANLNPVPVGVFGEICIAGAGTARGYLNRDDLTEEKFISDPFKEGERLYRTGDLGRWLSDGTIEFLGRNDDQVKIRGYRIELGEIENCLLSHDAMKETTVIAKAFGGNSEELAAYVVSRSGSHELNIKSLREHLEKTLPAYMIPSYFVRMEKLPLTPSGKTDKNALPDPADAGMDSGTEYATPRNEAESAIITVWSDVLGRKQISLYDNYFAMGGDSIKAIQVVSRLLGIGWKLEMRDLFRHSTAAELAPYISRARESAVQEKVSGTVPLTPIQKWFFEEVKPAPHHYNQAVMLKGKPCFEEKALQTALNALWNHHDTLRMQYVMSEETLIQRYADTGPSLYFEIVDLRETEQADSEMEAHADALQASTDMEKGPLMRTALYRLEDADRLLIAIHHLVTDGVSWRIMLEDLAGAYEQVLEEQSVLLPLKTDSFRTWAKKIHEYSRSRSLANERDYWYRMAAAPPVPLPSDITSLSPLLFPRSSSVSTEFSEAETDMLLTGVHHAYNTRIDDLLLAALAKAVRAWTGKNETLILLEGHGREDVIRDADVSRTVGWFTSIYPVRLTLPETEDPGQEIREIKETLRRIPKKGIGYGILRYIAGDKELSRSQWPEICFNYLGQFDEATEAERFSVSAKSPGQTTAPNQKQLHALDINGIIIKKQLSLSVDYDSTRFLESTVLRFLGNFRQALLKLCEHCRNRKEEEKTPGDFIYSDISTEEFGNILEELT